MSLFVLRQGYRVVATPTGGRVVHVRTGDAMNVSAEEVQLLARASTGAIDSSDPTLMRLVRRLASLNLLVPAKGAAPAGPATAAEQREPAPAPAPPPPVHAPSEVVPAFRGELEVVQRPGSVLFDVRDPKTGKSFILYDFEVSLARMLNGRRKFFEVVEAGLRVGIPVNATSLAQFVRQLDKYGFLAPAGSELPAPKGESTRAKRERWNDGIRTLFQTGLRLSRQGRYAEASGYLEALLEQDPTNGQATELLEKVKERQAAPPRQPDADALDDNGLASWLDEELAAFGREEGAPPLTPTLPSSEVPWQAELDGAAPELDLAGLGGLAAGAPADPSGEASEPQPLEPSQGGLHPAPLDPLPAVPAPVVRAKTLEVSWGDAEAAPPESETPIDFQAQIQLTLDEASIETPESSAPVRAPPVLARPEPAAAAAALTTEDSALDDAGAVLSRPKGKAKVVAAAMVAVMGIGGLAFWLTQSRGPAEESHAPGPRTATPAGGQGQAHEETKSSPSVEQRGNAQAEAPTGAEAAALPAPSGKTSAVDERASAVDGPEGKPSATARAVDENPSAPPAAGAADNGRPSESAPPSADGKPGARTQASAAGVSGGAGGSTAGAPLSGPAFTIARRGRVVMGELKAPSAGTVEWTVAVEAHVRKGQEVGVLRSGSTSTPLHAPVEGLLRPKLPQGAGAKRGQALAALAFVEAYLQTVVKGIEPKADWSCQVSTAAGQRAPCKLVSVSPRGGGFFVTATTAPTWFDEAKEARLQLAAP